MTGITRLFAILLFAAAGTAQAAATGDADGTVLVMKPGDATAGEGKAEACVACHGQDGNAAAPVYPNLAGQPRRYLYKAMMDYKNEVRTDPVMAAEVAKLSEQDIADLAAWYATQSVSAGQTPEDLVEAGAQLYHAGDAERDLPACMSCHGPAGLGNSAAGWPALGGQNVDYTIGQLKRFRSGDRTSDLNMMMRDIAAELSDEDINTLAHYLSGLHAQRFTGAEN